MRMSATGMIHASRLSHYFASHFSTIDDFFDDAERGTPARLLVHRAAPDPRPQRLPPRHRRAGARTVGRRAVLDPRRGRPAGPHLHRRPRLIDHAAAPTSPTPCSWSRSTNTAALTTTYHHPESIHPTRPHQPVRWDSDSTAPAYASPPWPCPPTSTRKTVVTSPYRNTSLIRTLRERWNLGPPLTGRDATAADIAPVLARDTPRAQEDWPDVTPQPVPATRRRALAARQAAAAAGQIPDRPGHRASTPPTPDTSPTSTPPPPPDNKPTTT